MKEVGQQSVQVVASTTRARRGTSGSDDSTEYSSKDAMKETEVMKSPNGSWGPIFKNRENFVEMHLV
ncbi:hypothetical protein CHS0354_036435 [Potamilus streckersoni]|uniref:Uncharacterized protein n=1 Tax=Potamilus streckersoni TaxID=2493646 RepID=A0AAE0W3S0_9BIVA|nr:hypothetical protein CHS0354_036435 [Potamilus streckersoni]